VDERGYNPFCNVSRCSSRLQVIRTHSRLNILHERGIAVLWIQRSFKVPHPDPYPTRFGDEVSAGWPLQAFSKGDSTYQIFFVSDLSHLDVKWLPWLVNVTVLLAGCAIICYTRGFIRRRRRTARGSCLVCGYQLAGATTCPECGR